MMTIEEAIEKFHTELPPLVQSEFGSQECVDSLKKLEVLYNIPLTPLAVRVAIGELKLDKIIEYVVSEYSLEEMSAQRLATQLQSEVFNPILERLRFFNADSDKVMTIEQEKNFAEKIFHDSFTQEIQHDPVVIAAFNNRLFYIFAHDENFHSRLEKALYENGETISKQPLKNERETMTPTISHWLKDYIAHYGSQAYDSLSQSSFLTNSENAKFLSDQERTLVGKVLKTYINIKFFPDSMPSDDGTGWEIIPGGEQVIVSKLSAPAELSHKKESIVTSVPEISKVTPLKKPVQPIKKNNLVTPKAVKPSNQTSSTPSPSPELLNLKNMLLDYPQGSLERQAIEEEIKKMERS